jgi:ribosomal protein S20
VRTAERRAAVNQPRRSAAKTLVTKAVKVATGGQPGDANVALRDALSALDRAAKAGAIHANAAARRKSRLTRKINAALGGEHVQTTAKLTKTTGKAAAVKAAKSRIALAKADKAKGAQTAAGKARAALSKTARAEAAASAAAAASSAAKPEAAAVKPAKATPRKAPAKAPAKATAKTATAKAPAKATATKAAKPTE